MAWKNPWYDSSKPHHTAEGFRNPEPDSRQQGDLQRWRRERKARDYPIRLVRAMTSLLRSGGNLPI